MLIQSIILAYRLSASVVVILPTLINVIFIGNIVTSLLYVPILSLILAIFFIHVDRQFTELLTTLFTNNEQCISANKASTDALKKTNDFHGV